MFGQLRTLTEQAGREPAEVGIEVWVSMDSWNGSGLGEGDPVLERKPAVRTTNFNRRHHHRSRRL